MAWLILFVAGLFEIAWAIGLKASDGFTKVGTTAWTIVAYLASFVLLGLALRTLPVGTGYAVWTGIGTAGAAILGITLFDEPRDAGRLACIGLIIVGIVGLKVLTPPTSPSPSMDARDATTHVQERAED